MACEVYRLKGHVTPEKTREKIRQSLLGNVPWNKGKKTGPLSAEHRAKLSISGMGKNAGRKRPDLVRNLRKWVASPDYVNPMKGKKRPDLAANNRTPEKRAAQSRALQGRVFSPETIAKMRAAQAARWARVRAAAG